MEKINVKDSLLRGIIRENPIFVAMLGLCPTLGVTSTAANGIGMGAATTFVLLMSNTVISLIKNIVPAQVRIPAYVVIIAACVTLIDLLMAAYTPGVHEQLGLFIPLIVVNCIVLGRAEAFASRNSVGISAIDGLGQGIGFTMALTAIGMIREFFGNLSFLGLKIADADGMLVFILAPGAFITLGFLIAIKQWLSIRNKKLGRTAATKKEVELPVEA